MIVCSFAEKRRRNRSIRMTLKKRTLNNSFCYCLFSFPFLLLNVYLDPREHFYRFVSCLPSSCEILCFLSFFAVVEVTRLTMIPVQLCQPLRSWRFYRVFVGFLNFFSFGGDFHKNNQFQHPWALFTCLRQDLLSCIHRNSCIQSIDSNEKAKIFVRSTYRRVARIKIWQRDF